MVDVEKNVQFEAADQVEAETSEIKRADFGVSYSSWSIQLKHGSKTVHFWTYPFAVTVVSTPHRGSSLFDWWVSAAEEELGIAELVFRSSYLVPATTVEEIERTIREYWEGAFHQVAASSSKEGGFTAASSLSVDYTRSKKEEIVKFHMQSHDEMWERMGGKRSKVATTVGYHKLIKSFGLKQTQQLIAQHEWVSDIMNEAKAHHNRLGELQDISTAHINQRLQQAKKMGLLTPEASSTSNVSANRKMKTNERSRTRKDD